jgi:KaiC/GvpD/RAD55 family RecA-like ATPase
MTAHQFAPRVSPRTDLVQSGITPIDAQLDGLMPARTYVLSGAPGTGKSVAALQFLMAGIKAGQRAAILTQDDPQDLLSQGEFLGVDIAREVEAGHLVLLRFTLDFSRRFSRATSPELAFAELRSVLAPESPTRFVIDSVVPFIDAGGSSDSSAVAMLQLLDELGATSLVTYPGDLAGVYDRRLDPLIQRAAGIFHLSADRLRQRHIEIRKVRYRVPSVAPITYRIEAGHGLVPASDDVRWPQDEAPAFGNSQRLVLDLPPEAAQEALRMLQSHYNVRVANGAMRVTPPRPMSVLPARRASDFPDSASPQISVPAQPTRSGARVPFDGPSFRAAVQAVTALDPLAFFSVLVITAPPGELTNLAAVTLRTVRAVNGDLVGAVNNQVLIYLHGTGRKHAPCFADRLRDTWQNEGQGELIIDYVAYPTDQERLRSLLSSIV